MQQRTKNRLLRTAKRTWNLSLLVAGTFGVVVAGEMLLAWKLGGFDVSRSLIMFLAILSCLALVSFGGRTTE